jgi:predicted DNA-binding protein (MmcQ/YjbR family)
LNNNEKNNQLFEPRRSLWLFRSGVWQKRPLKARHLVPAHDARHQSNLDCDVFILLNGDALPRFFTMNIETFRAYCLAKSGVTESFPFDEVTLVFKVGGKIFALTSLDQVVLKINLKCNPERAQQLRETYDAVRPGYHMNKKHWNTITVDGSVKNAELLTWIDHSYELVVQSLPRKLRAEL